MVPVRPPSYRPSGTPSAFYAGNNRGTTGTSRVAERGRGRGGRRRVQRPEWVQNRCSELPVGGCVGDRGGLEKRLHFTPKRLETVAVDELASGRPPPDTGSTLGRTCGTCSTDSPPVPPAMTRATSSR